MWFWFTGLVLCMSVYKGMIINIRFPVERIEFLNAGSAIIKQIAALP